MVAFRRALARDEARSGRSTKESRTRTIDYLVGRYSFPVNSSGFSMTR